MAINFQSLLKHTPSSPGFAATSFQDGTGTTRTGGGPGKYGYEDVLNAFIMNRLARPLRASGPNPAPPKRPAMGGAGAHHRVLETGDAAQARDMSMQDAIAARNFEAEKRGVETAPPPTKTVTVGGQSFQTIDPLRLTGLQRQMFLPQGSSMGPHEGSGFADGGNVGGADFQRFAKGSPDRLAYDPNQSEGGGGDGGSPQQQALLQMLQMLRAPGGG